MLKLREVSEAYMQIVNVSLRLSTQPIRVLNRIYLEHNTYTYTGGTLQQLDTDVHSAVTAMVRIVMSQRWQWQHWDISGYDTDVTAMFTLVTISWWLKQAVTNIPKFRRMFVFVQSVQLQK